MKQEFVRDWMARKVIEVTPTTPLVNARKLMKQHGIRRLPVIEDDELVGIITRSDIHTTDAPEMNSLTIGDLHETLSHIMVKGEMTPDPITVHAEDSLGVAAKLMLDNKISGLPVVDDDRRVIGMITESDIFRAVVRIWEE